jgi:hypothetical protein
MTEDKGIFGVLDVQAMKMYGPDGYDSQMYKDRVVSEVIEIPKDDKGEEQPVLLFGRMLDALYQKE